MAPNSSNKGVKRGPLITIATMDSTSPAEPRAVSKKESNSAVDIRSNPSAMLLETDSAARSIWLRNPFDLLSAICYLLFSPGACPGLNVP